MVRLNWDEVVTDEDIVLRVRKAIKQCKIEQNKLAELAGIPYKQFNALLSCRKTLRGEHIIKFCRVLKIAPNDLLGYKGEE